MVITEQTKQCCFLAAPLTNLLALATFNCFWEQGYPFFWHKIQMLGTRYAIGSEI